MNSRLFSLAAVLLLAGCNSNSTSGASSSSTATPAAAGGATAPGGQNHVHSIAVLPTNANTVYLGAHYALLKSTNGGSSWHPLMHQMMLSLTIDQARPSTIYGVSSTHGLLVSTNSGATWKPVASPIPAGKAVGVVTDPSGTSVYAYGLGVYRSADGGAHWVHSLAGTSVSSLAVGSQGTVYAAGGNGLEVSRDQSSHWKPVGAIGSQPVLQVAAAGTTAYAVTATVPLFRTTNSGRTWKALSHAPVGIEFIGVSTTSPNEIIGEIAQQGFVRSDNGGQTWHKASAGIRDSNFSASTVRIAPSNPQIAYTGAWGVHFYASHDGGARWTRTATLLK